VQLGEALKTIYEYASAESLPPTQVLLVTGFNPLHLQTFFPAHLQRQIPKSRVNISTGVYDY